MARDGYRIFDAEMTEEDDVVGGDYDDEE